MRVSGSNVGLGALLAAAVGCGPGAGDVASSGLRGSGEGSDGGSDAGSTMTVGGTTVAMTTAQLLVTVGGAIYFAMGTGHAWLTVLDVRRPKHFTPIDDRVREQMSNTGVRFARGRASMWNAWLGLNISHGLGVAFFGLVTVAAANYTDGALLHEAAVMPVVLAVSLIHLLLVARFWFWGPLVGTIVNTACFAGAWALL